MAFSIKDKATDSAVRRLARLKRSTLTDAIREAVENEYRRSRGAEPLPQRLQRLADRYAQYPLSDEVADKAFFDDLSGDA